MSVPTDIRRVVTVEADAYSWKNGSRVKADAEKAVMAFRRIYQRDGAVTPASVVEAARPDDSVLHNEFEWSDAEAARVHREQQASYLLRSVVVVYKRPDSTLTQPVRAFVKIVPSADDPALDDATADAMEPHVYLPVRTVVDEEALRRRWKRQALDALISWRRQYRDIEDFARIFEQIDALSAREQQVG